MRTGFPAEPGSPEPMLGHLIAALTTAAHPDERAGRDAALDAFRAVRPDDHAARRRAWFAVLTRSARVTVVAATAVSALAGVTAAAYAAALPAPVQHIAYRVLAPLGVPQGKRGGGRGIWGREPPCREN